MARRKSLDEWAIALGKSDDDSVIAQLAVVERVVRDLQGDYAKVCDQLRGVDERVHAARVADRLDVVQEGLFWVKRDFLLHERGV
jgi:hypothetical protein